MQQPKKREATMQNMRQKSKNQF